MGRPKTPVTAEQVSQIKQFVSTAGYGAMQKAAKKFGLSYFIIRGIVGKVTRKNVQRQKRKRGRPALPVKVKKQAIALRDTLKAFEKLSKQFAKLTKAVQVLKG